MSENTKIEWAHHTFNPWIGCTKVSEACRNCYAENYANRYGRAEWGKDKPRSRTSDANWRKPLSWDKKAAAAGERHRVFCASLADIFDEEVSDTWRLEVFKLIASTPNLDWLLLTKRPEKMGRFMGAMNELCAWPNVWLGITVEDQRTANERIPILLDTPAAKRFLSMEPLLGPVDLSGFLPPDFDGDINRGEEFGEIQPGEIDWVIVGGESGPGARPMHPDWARSLRDQCEVSETPFMFKQWGAWAPYRNHIPGGSYHWFGAESGPPDMVRIGKKRAGRLLDGQTWDGVPS